MKKIRGSLLLILVFSFLLFINVTTIIRAAGTQPQGQVTQPAGAGGTVSLPNPLGENNNDPREVIGQGIKVILGVLGSITLAVFIYGGLLWLTSAGNDQRIKKGKDVLFWAVLGLLVIFSAYTIINFFLGGQFLGIFFI